MKTDQGERSKFLNALTRTLTKPLPLSLNIHFIEAPYRGKSHPFTKDGKDMAWNKAYTGTHGTQPHTVVVVVLLP